MVFLEYSTSEQVLSLIRQLRGAGFFTVVALASPFEFEGSRKTESANKLIEEVHHAAHLVSVIEQVHGSFGLTALELCVSHQCINSFQADSEFLHVLPFVLCA